MMLTQKFLAVLFIIVTAIVIYSQEMEKDHPAISRYKGAEIRAVQIKDYVPYVLGTGPQEIKDEEFRGHRKYFSKYLDLEGKLTRIQYQVPLEEGLFKVFKNYENALNNSGFQILFTTSEKESSYPFWNEDVYHSE